MTGKPISLRPAAAGCWRMFVDGWLPRSCALCERALGGEEAACCAWCRRRIAGGDASRCPICAARTPAARVCARCHQRPPALEATHVLGDYAPPLDRLIAALKFDGRIHLAGALATMLLERHRHHLDTVDRVVPVPLAPGRLAERGYNQALEIARGVARGIGSPLVPHALRRQRITRPQPGLARGDRRRNLAGALAWHGGPLAAGARVVLVDDVMTTGATLDEAATVLRAAGARHVIALVAARTPAPVASGERPPAAADDGSST